MLRGVRKPSSAVQNLESRIQLCREQVGGICLGPKELRAGDNLQGQYHPTAGIVHPHTEEKEQTY